MSTSKSQATIIPDGSQAKCIEESALGALLKAFAEAGIDISSRPGPGIAAGICSGLISDLVLFAEAVGSHEGVILAMRAWTLFHSEQVESLKALLEKLNANPEFTTEGERWLRFHLTKREVGVEFVVVAKFVFTPDAEDAHQRCREQAAAFHTKVNVVWVALKIEAM